MVTSDATRSAPSRRPTNDSATADSSSSHCASSTTTRTGCARAASATRLRTARPTRNGSRASYCALPSTPSSAPRCGSGSPSTQSRSSSTSWCTAAYPKTISDSTPTMRTTRKPDPPSIAYWTSADFPMPAGPENKSAPATPRSASPRSASIVARSVARPTRGLPRCVPCPGSGTPVTTPPLRPPPSTALRLIARYCRTSLRRSRRTRRGPRSERRAGTSTLSARGSDSNTSGASIATLSPSIPSATAVAESTRNVGVVHSDKPPGGGPVTAMIPSTPPSRSPLVPCRGRGSITYGLLATNTSAAVSCARPSCPMKRRSNGSASGPINSGIMSITVRTLCSRYADDCTTAPYTPMATLFTNARPLTRPRSMRRSCPSVNASSAPTTSLRSMPRSRAKWFRVPAGTHTYGRSCSAATAATAACDPSPPAMPRASAPARTAAVARVVRSSPGSKRIGSMPRARHCATRSKRAAFPPPERGLTMRTEITFCSSSIWARVG